LSDEEKYAPPPFPKFMMLNGGVFILLAIIAFSMGIQLFTAIVGFIGVTIFGIGLYCHINNIDPTGNRRNR